MADLSFMGFDPTKVEPATGFKLIPAGNYLCVIEDSEVTQTKNGTGLLLVLRCNVVDGPYANRKLTKRLNIQNNSAEAQAIGQRELSQLCHALGRLQPPRDSSEFHLIPFMARVVVSKDKTGQFSDRNEIREFMPLAGQIAAATTTPPAFQKPAAGPKPAAPAANGKAPAWVQR